jgi:hypothetical protein
VTEPSQYQDDPSPQGATVQAIVAGGSPGAWNWKQLAHDAATMNGIEAWVFALQGDYKRGTDLMPDDLDRYDLAVVNMNFGYLPHYRQALATGRQRRAKLVGLFEGDLAQLEKQWKEWGEVADCCDLIISINDFGTSFLQALTSTPVSYIGIPFPVDGIRSLTVPIEERHREIFLCASPLTRSNDYVAAQRLGLPMLAYEKSFSRRWREVMQHRSLDKMRYIKRARDHYNNPRLTILARTHLRGYLERVARSLIWMDLDTRYTWGRFVLDAAALGIPIITTPNTWHGPRIFPELTVESPYDARGAHDIATRLLDDPAFYRQVVEQASAGMDWYRPEQTVERLMKELEMVDRKSAL